MTPPFGEPIDDQSWSDMVEIEERERVAKLMEKQRRKMRKEMTTVEILDEEIRRLEHREEETDWLEKDEKQELRG